MATKATIDVAALGITWQANTTYRIALDEGFYQEEGNLFQPNLANANLKSFTTNASGPTIASTSPADNATGVENNTFVEIVFDRPVSSFESSTLTLRKTSDNTVVKTFNLPADFQNISSTTKRLNVTGVLEANTAYHFLGSIITRDADNFAQNTTYSSPSQFNFTTADATFPDLRANLSSTATIFAAVGFTKQFSATLAVSSSVNLKLYPMRLYPPSYGEYAAISGTKAILGSYSNEIHIYDLNIIGGDKLFTVSTTGVEDVDITDNLAIAGAPFQGTGGRAYIINTNTGNIAYTLENPNAFGTTSGDQFGNSVAISSSYALVGALAEDETGATNSGKVYVFNPSTGALTRTIDNPAASNKEFDIFGKSLAVSGDLAIIGSSGVGDGGGNNSGVAYIYNLSTGNLVHTLTNPNAFGTSAGDQFGHSVAISGSYAIVGAPFEDDADGTSSGKAYVYNTSTGALLYTLNNPNPFGTSASDLFGEAVAISGSYALVGARNEDESLKADAGKAYLYNLTNGSLVHTFNNPLDRTNDDKSLFGIDVGISNDLVIIHSANLGIVGGTTSLNIAFVYKISEL